MMMLNIDKYREEIMSESEIEIECKIAAFREVGGMACANNLCDVCRKRSLRWLFCEYEPPLLKNGDDLKPGDWIMVRNNDDWRKRVFMCYKDGYFITSDGGEIIGVCGGYSAWKQARLPEDGE